MKKWCIVNIFDLKPELSLLTNHPHLVSKDYPKWILLIIPKKFVKPNPNKPDL